jgi:hypothetical protein
MINQIHDKRLIILIILTIFEITLYIYMMITKRNYILNDKIEFTHSFF